MINDYVFRTKGRLPFFLSAPVFKEAEYKTYTEADIEKDASMLMILLLNSFHPGVGVALRHIMDRAGELAQEADEIKKDDPDVNISLSEAMRRLEKNRKETAAFFDRLQTMATERLMTLPEEDKPPIT